ncbi:MAG: hypothetical protein ACXAD7_21745, partial [Candidatus Kariarchaeaceae archaeon]
MNLSDTHLGDEKETFDYLRKLKVKSNLYNGTLDYFADKSKVLNTNPQFLQQLIKILKQEFHPCLASISAFQRETSLSFLYSYHVQDKKDEGRNFQVYVSI